MSLTVAEVIKHVVNTHGDRWEPHTIATALALICGFITLGMGLLRIGWLVEFIPAPAVSGFMTGSAITIAAGQFPGLMGISGFECVGFTVFISLEYVAYYNPSTRAATYKVIINSLKGLPRTKVDAAFGLTGLFSLYAIRFACEWGQKKWPRRARWFFFASVMRNAFVIIILTLASFLYCRTRQLPNGKYPIKILLTVPSGFKHVKQPSLELDLLSAIAGKLPVATIILLLEHIAISKCE
jgi:sodium-independent sulfate anion transporter 11